METRTPRTRTPNPLLAGVDEGVVPAPRSTLSAEDPSSTDGTSPPRARSSSTGLTQSDIDSFKALGAEVRFEHPEWGEFWLVPEYTDQDRLEITPEHLAKVSAALRTFGGRVIRFGRIPPEPEAPAVSLAAARAHLHRLARLAVA